MASGEIKSLRAAALEAGFVKESIQVPADPQGIVRVLRRHLGDDDLLKLATMILQQNLGGN